MKEINEWIRKLNQQDVTFWLDNERLRLDGPRDVLTPELLQALKDRKPELMFALQSQTGNSKISVANSRSETALLSYAQERLWFLDELEGSSALYNMASVLRLRGSIDVVALERSLQTIVERHEALRTAITSDDDGRPYQQVSDERLSLVQLSLDDSALWPRVAEEKARPFDLSEALKIRASLFHVKSSGVEGSPETQEAILMIALHHIASDGWSMGVLQRELSELYGAYRSGNEPELPALPIQYADYALWQREWLTGERLSSQLSYWQTQLACLLYTSPSPRD